MLSTQFVQTMVLARLLSPQDYGMFSVPFAILMIFMHLYQKGISSAVLSTKDPSRMVVRNANSLSLVAALTLVLVYNATGMVLAQHGGAGNETSEIFLALSSALFCSCVTSPLLGLQQRRMMFVTIAVSQLMGMMVGAIVSISLAAYGYGVWSIVAGTSLNYVVTALFTVMVLKFDLAFGIHKRAIKFLLWRTFQFSYLRVIDTIWFQSPILVGTFKLGIAELGLVQRSSYLIDIGLQAGLGRLGLMFFSLISPRIRKNQPIARMLYIYFWGFCIILMPFITVCVVCSASIILVVFGPKWSAAIPDFKAFAVGYGLIWISQPFSQMAELTAILRIRTLVFVASILTFSFLVVLGLTTIPVSWAIGGAVTFGLNIILGCRQFNLSLSHVIKLSLPGLLSSAAIIVLDRVAGPMIAFQGIPPIGVLVIYCTFALFSAVVSMQWLTPKSIRHELNLMLRSYGDNAMGKAVRRIVRLPNVELPR
jgi:O-antigen/teichoic acid export membrane protein